MLGSESERRKDCQNSLEVIHLKPESIKRELSPMLANARRACKVAVVEVGEYHCEELVDVPQRPTVAAM